MTLDLGPCKSRLVGISPSKLAFDFPLRPIVVSRHQLSVSARLRLREVAGLIEPRDTTPGVYRCLCC